MLRKELELLPFKSKIFELHKILKVSEICSYKKINMTLGTYFRILNTTFKIIIPLEIILISSYCEHYKFLNSHGYHYLSCKYYI